MQDWIRMTLETSFRYDLRESLIEYHDQQSCCAGTCIYSQAAEEALEGDDSECPFGVLEQPTGKRPTCTYTKFQNGKGKTIEITHETGRPRRRYGQ